MRPWVFWPFNLAKPTKWQLQSLLLLLSVAWYSPTSQGDSFCGIKLLDKELHNFNNYIPILLTSHPAASKSCTLTNDQKPLDSLSVGGNNWLSKEKKKNKQTYSSSFHLMCDSKGLTPCTEHQQADKASSQKGLLQTWQYVLQISSYLTTQLNIGYQQCD